ncbi:AAA family ATPase [Steroidobacter flavus]|uniref:AAA family ATPase n=1 Tax=Steroidobacter flavus TaxID=1842136 RepID=A0ABV8T1K9_9GAMM
MTTPVNVRSVTALRAGSTLPALTPSQATIFNRALAITEGSPFVVVQGDQGVGKTTILQHLHARFGGRFISCAELLDAIAARHPHAIEESIRGLLDGALTRDDVVFVDDLDAVEKVTRMSNAYPRPHLFNVVLKDIFNRVRLAKKKLFLSNTTADFYSTVEGQSVILECPPLQPADYQALITAWLGKEHVARLNIESIYRRSGKLTAYQLQATCGILLAHGRQSPTTEEFTRAVSENLLSSNLDVAEVEKIEFSALKGAKEIVEKLERTILLPLKEPELAKALGLKPKRGVLLHGHPGTGKTTIGRALAHQMAGQFFMIDGSFVGGSPGFFRRLDRLFEDAIANSPSIVFIDDADVLFKADNGGINRYLLTKLDGLASESVGHVCVMMTAMDVADMPPALLRSGRMEVWLETRLPTSDTRIEIVRHFSSDLPKQHHEFDEAKLSQLTDGFTPADLRRLVGDARGFLAYDQHKGRTVQRFEEYLYVSAAEIADIKAKIAAISPKRGAVSAR